MLMDGLNIVSEHQRPFGSVPQAGTLALRTIVPGAWMRKTMLVMPPSALSPETS